MGMPYKCSTIDDMHMKKINRPDKSFFYLSRGIVHAKCLTVKIKLSNQNIKLTINEFTKMRKKANKKHIELNH